MPTNRVTKGNSLSGAVLQPGWTIENDGFGLLTSRATYTKSHGNDAGTRGGDGKDGLAAGPQRGQPFSKDGRLVCHRASSSLNSNGLLVITAEFVGIENGSMTVPQVSGRGSMSTEPITTHPKFESALGGKVSAPLNGATFKEDGSFIAFSEHTSPRDKYGVKSYLVPGFGINGHFYCASIGVAASLKASMGTTSENGYWNNINLLGGLAGIGPSWNGVGSFKAENESPQLLLTGIELEFFGNLVKISYDITFATNGWDTDIYPYTAGMIKKGSSDKSTTKNGWPTVMHEGLAPSLF